MTDLRERFEGFAERLGAGGRAVGPRPRAFKEEYWRDYWRTVQDLFTRDVTGRGLRELLEQETRDTFQFFTREIDFSDLPSRPWHRRYPLALWRVFLAVAYRLSPWRRILFALSAPLLALAWLRYLLSWLTHGPWSLPPMGGWEDGILICATVVFFLLVLELRDKLGLKGDLEIARQIQFGLLPFEPYAREGVSIVTAMRPANTVGGDYFDLVELPDGRLSLAVGDVAGKGMPAALLMALLQGSLRTLLTAGLRGPDLLAKLNAHLCANIPSNRLITFFYAELEPASGLLRYVNAGHNPPFLVRQGGSVERLGPTAIALGVTTEAAFEAMSGEVEPGDRLLLYTDGITEAFNARDEEYGEERLGAYLAVHREASHQELIDGIVADVLRFCGAVRPRDDMTLMALGRAR